MTNGGSHKYNMIGMFKVILICSHYNPGSLKNIFSLKYVASIPGAHMTIYTLQERVILVNLSNGSVIKIKAYSEGLYSLTLTLVPLTLITFPLPNTL